MVEKDKLLEKALALAKKGKEELIRSTKIGKTMFESSALQHQKKKYYQELGALAYKLIKESKIKIEDSAALVQKIDELEKEIKGKEKEIKSLKGK